MSFVVEEFLDYSLKEFGYLLVWTVWINVEVAMQSKFEF